MDRQNPQELTQINIQTQPYTSSQPAPKVNLGLLLYPPSSTPSRDWSILPRLITLTNHCSRCSLALPLISPTSRLPLHFRKTPSRPHMLEYALFYYLYPLFMILLDRSNIPNHRTVLASRLSYKMFSSVPKVTRLSQRTQLICLHFTRHALMLYPCTLPMFWRSQICLVS